jgi:6-phosphogluconolactonase
MIMALKNRKIQIAADAEAMSRAAAETIAEHICELLQTRDRYSIALSGGSTPRRLYALLAGDSELCGRIPWDRVHFFWGDERHVPPNHPESNYHMASEAMLSRVPIPPGNIHRIRAEQPDAHKAAADYDDEIRRFFDLSSGEMPRFNCVLLGMGSDGHTASLFPGSPALDEQKRLVVASWVEKLQSFRITLTPAVFNNADLILMLVSGSQKAETIKSLLAGSPSPESYPVQWIQPKHGDMLWFLDRSAAKFLDVDSHGFPSD